MLLRFVLTLEPADAASDSFEFFDEIDGLIIDFLIQCCNLSVHVLEFLDTAIPKISEYGYHDEYAEYERPAQNTRDMYIYDNSIITSGVWLFGHLFIQFPDVSMVSVFLFTLESQCIQEHRFIDTVEPL